MNDPYSYSKEHRQKGSIARNTIVLGLLFISVMTLSSTGCGFLAQKVADSVAQKAVGGIVGIIADFSLLLSKVESDSHHPHRIVIAFNGSRYDPWGCAWASSHHKSSELPFKRAYHINLRLDSVRGQAVTIATQMDLPTDTESSRIPVEVASFPDPTQQLPLARVDEIFVTGNQSRTIQHWFEYSADDWRRVTKK